MNEVLPTVIKVCLDLDYFGKTQFWKFQNLYIFNIKLRKKNLPAIYYLLPN